MSNITIAQKNQITKESLRIIKNSYIEGIKKRNNKNNYNEIYDDDNLYNKTEDELNNMLMKINEKAFDASEPTSGEIFQPNILGYKLFEIANDYYIKGINKNHNLNYDFTHKYETEIKVKINTILKKH